MGIREQPAVGKRHRHVLHFSCALHDDAGGGNQHFTETDKERTRVMTYEFLQQYWWFLVSLLGALLVFLLFVQGANSLVGSLGGDA